MKVTIKEEETEEEERGNDMVDRNKNVLMFNVNIDKSDQFNDSDWCIQNQNSVDNLTQDYGEAVNYSDLKEYCYQKCFLCFKIFPDSYSLAEHNLKHIIIPLLAPLLYQCDYCLVYYTSKSDLISHIQAKHRYEEFGVQKTKALHQCKICLKSFTYKNWHGHMTNVHGDKSIKCRKCNLVFKCQRYLKRHNLYVHDGQSKPKCKPKPIECSQCPKVFKNRDCLNHHVKNCHGESVECHICKSKLKSKSYLNTHMRRVHYDDGKVHKCQICMKPFRSPRYVSIHVKNAHQNRQSKSQLKTKNCSNTKNDAWFDVHLLEHHSVIVRETKIPIINNGREHLNQMFKDEPI